MNVCCIPCQGHSTLGWVTTPADRIELLPLTGFYLSDLRVCVLMFFLSFLNAFVLCEGDYHYLVVCIFWCCESVLELAFVLCQVVCGRFKVSLGVSWSARAVFVHGLLGSIPLAPTVVHFPSTPQPEATPHPTTP